MEEDIELLEKLKMYLQIKIDSGYHKLAFNDLMHDFKTIDAMYAIKNLINKYKEQKNTIDLMALSISSYDSQLVINQFINKEEVKEYYKEKAKGE